MDDVSGVTVRPVGSDERNQIPDSLRRALVLCKQRLPESVARVVEDLQDLGEGGFNQVERVHRPSRNITQGWCVQCAVSYQGIRLTGAREVIGVEAHADVWQTRRLRRRKLGRNLDYSQPEVRRPARVISTRRNWVWDFACRVAASSRILAWSQSLLTPSPFA
jgi:hypothetical protein